MLGHRRAGPGGDRRPGEGGVTIVELAIILPLLLVLALGVVDVGFAIRADMTMKQATRSGARTAASVGSQTAADFQILRSIGSAAGALDDAEIGRVIVFKATASDGAVPPDCLTAPNGIAGTCNVYGSEAFTAEESCFQGSSCPGVAAAAWPSASRVSSQAGAGPDYVGVHMTYRQRSFTAFFPWSEFNLSTTTVMRLEPGS